MDPITMIDLGLSMFATSYLIPDEEKEEVTYDVDDHDDKNI